MLHTGLGAEVRRWFQQLRRLQSLMHATKAGAPATAERSSTESICGEPSCAPEAFTEASLTGGAAGMCNLWGVRPHFRISSLMRPRPR